MGGYQQDGRAGTPVPPRLPPPGRCGRRNGWGCPRILFPSSNPHPDNFQSQVQIIPYYFSGLVIIPQLCHNTPMPPRAIQRAIQPVCERCRRPGVIGHGLTWAFGVDDDTATQGPMIGHGTRLICQGCWNPAPPNVEETQRKKTVAHTWQRLKRRIVHPATCEAKGCGQPAHIPKTRKWTTAMIYCPYHLLLATIFGRRPMNALQARPPIFSDHSARGVYYGGERTPPNA